MSCGRIREGLSARLDGAPDGQPTGALDAHLAACPGCAAWLVEAQRVTRLVRLQSTAVPDLTAPVLAAVAADAAARSVSPLPGWRQILRLAVAVAAFGQLVVALPALVAGANVTGDLHTSREMASFDVALAVGFALAAWRPQRVRAVLPVALVLAVCLAATSLVDVVRSAAVPWHEVGHVVTVVQALLLWALGRADRAPAGAARRAVTV
ncbi:membrane protein [Pilimelia anulata]|uniref:Membrane protein n=1 Tax=Pilimelia anulata TaxID=53371 RepID=A0A8J3FDZ5_9ACTN|nr:zf-HC2 domain-containing protein [Pilimelia anulata]GGK06389.1 membrane protein [Pilimelia anulata]